MFLLEEVEATAKEIGFEFDQTVPYLTTPSGIAGYNHGESAAAWRIRQLETHLGLHADNLTLGRRWTQVLAYLGKGKPQAKPRTPFDGVKGQVLLFAGMYHPDLCRMLPDLTFVFGDNEQRVGNGGQACIRPCSNTFGVATKRTPGGATHDHFHDGVPGDMGVLCENLHTLEGLILQGKRVVLPITREGRISLGCGLSNLPYFAPLAYAFIERWFDRVCRVHKAVTVK